MRVVHVTNVLRENIQCTGLSTNSMGITLFRPTCIQADAQISSNLSHGMNR